MVKRARWANGFLRRAPEIDLSQAGLGGDLGQLAGEDEVQAMLRSPECQAIKEDYEKVSLKLWGGEPRDPARVSPAFIQVK